MSTRSIHSIALKTAVGCTLLVATGCGAGQTDPGEGTAGGAPPSSVSAPSDAIGVARQRLEGLTPTWKPADVARAPNVYKWDAPTRPLDFTKGLVPESLTFMDRRDGRDRYMNTDTGVAVLADAGRGLFSVIRGRDALKAGATAFGRAQAEAAAHELFVSAGVPEAEQGEMFSSDVIVATPGGEKTVVARHVRFNRAVNNLRVKDSVWMATFNLNGMPYRVEAKWPAFQLAKNAAAFTRQDALDTLSGRLAEQTDGPTGVSDVKVELAYEPSASGEFEPVVSMWTFHEHGAAAPDLTQYSLASGLRKAVTTTTAH